MKTVLEMPTLMQFCLVPALQLATCVIIWLSLCTADESSHTNVVQTKTDCTPSLTVKTSLL